MIKRILLISTLIAILAFVTNYIFATYKQKKLVERNSNRIEMVLNKTFNYATSLSTVAGKKIVNSDHHNLKKIHSIFVNIAKTQNIKDSAICWTFLDWVNRGNKQLVNTVTGINKNPPDMAKLGREYSWKMVKKPWELKFSKPTIGVPSNDYTIPAGLWVKKNNNFIGAVALGISINKLNNKIMAQINKNIDFMIINKDDYNLVFKSEVLARKITPTYQQKSYKNWASISSKKRILPVDGFIDKPIKIKDMKYIHSKELKEEYPYIILTGYNSNLLFKKIVKDSFIIFLQVFGISLILAILLRRKS